MRKIVIHLNDGSAESLKRRESFQEELYGINYEVFEGFKIDPGHVGISESFKAVVRHNLDQESILIFEDDIKFTCLDSWEEFNKSIESLPEDWDILLGGSYHFDPVNEMPGFIKVGDFSSLHCVLVRNTAYESILSHNPNTQNPERNLDRHLGKLAQSGKLNVYLCNPMIALQCAGYSYNRGKFVDYHILVFDKNVLKD